MSTLTNKIGSGLLSVFSGVTSSRKNNLISNYLQMFCMSTSYIVSHSSSHECSMGIDNRDVSIIYGMGTQCRPGPPTQVVLRGVTPSSAGSSSWSEQAHKATAKYYQQCLERRSLRPHNCIWVVFSNLESDFTKGEMTNSLSSSCMMLVHGEFTYSLPGL